MGVVAEEIKAHHVFCLGDNFYVRQPPSLFMSFS
jgi:hypothetical protein